MSTKLTNIIYVTDTAQVQAPASACPSVGFGRTNLWQGRHGQWEAGIEKASRPRDLPATGVYGGATETRESVETAEHTERRGGDVKTHQGWVSPVSLSLSGEVEVRV